MITLLLLLLVEIIDDDKFETVEKLQLNMFEA